MKTQGRPFRSQSPRKDKVNPLTCSIVHPVVGSGISEAPLDDATDKGSGDAAVGKGKTPPPTVIVHAIQVQETSAKAVQQDTATSSTTSSNAPAAAIQTNAHSQTSKKKTSSGPVCADHGFAESASREPQLAPGADREARIAHHTQVSAVMTASGDGCPIREEMFEKELWAAGAADELFPAKAYTCRFCGLSYAYLNTLKAHERVHDVEEPFRCGKCGASFRFNSELDYHAQSHKGQKQYGCKCGRSFSLYTDMINHK